jgi:hypothetical protein
MFDKWKQTTIWKLLEKRGSAPAVSATRVLLETCLPTIETVLGKSGTAPADFTLHDEDHSFRVAERMIQIIPKKVLPKLSAYELGLLLLSAYLHDIGMSPGREKVQLFYSYLLIGSDGLSEADKHEFQQWLDDEGHELTPPLIHTTPSNDDLRLAGELITYFARHKHNDWSKDWILENLERNDWRGYEHWRDDLIDVCQSHHWGHDRLIDRSFDPKLLPSGDVVHLRYLACVLRVADIMENDPERTPDVILRHRKIAPGSQIYWWKDHEFVLQIETDRSVTLRAQPRSAVVQRAILETASAIEKELRLCVQLNAEKPFSQFPKHDPLPHSWDLSDALFADVKPYKSTFEYIEGAFRPDTQRLLEMLAGRELYGDHMASVRELLQNAYDAVREHIAYERLSLPDVKNPADPKWLIELGNKHEVSLTLKTDPEDPDIQWLICRDNGIGMTKLIIENHVLVSGNSRRRDVLALERRARAKGFSSERTGKFGIGVLSYFMIAEEVQITTRRSQIAGDADGEAWTFASTGVGDFGELRRAEPGPGGTEISLRLRKGLDLSLPISPETPSLVQYVNQLLAWSPCTTVVIDEQRPDRSIRFQSGWTRPLLPELAESVTRYSEEKDRFKAALDSMRDVVEEGNLPANLGRYRISLCYFELEGGISFAYFRAKMDGDTLKIVPMEKRDCLLAKSDTSFSYKGIKVSADSRPDLPPGCRVQIDWTNEASGAISVDRARFIPSREALKSFDSIREVANTMVRSLLTAHEQSNYSFFNQDIAKTWIKREPDFAWLTGSPDVTLSGVWQKIGFPAVALLDSFMFGLFAGLDLKTVATLFERYEERGVDHLVLGQGNLTWNGNILTILRAIKRELYSGDLWNLERFPPQRLCVSPSDFGMNLMPLWVDRPSVSHKFACEFPPGWDNVIGVKLEGSEFHEKTLLNTNHPLNKDSSQLPGLTFDPSKFDLMDPDPTNANSLLVWNVLRGQKEAMEQWNRMATEDPETTQRLFDTMWRDEPNPAVELLMLKEAEPPEGLGLSVLSASQATLLTGSALASKLPEVGPDWTIQIPCLDLKSLLP